MTVRHNSPAGWCTECGKPMRWLDEPKIKGTVIRKGKGVCCTCVKRLRDAAKETEPTEPGVVFTNAELRDWMDRMVARRRADGVPPEGVAMEPGETNAGAWELVS